MLRFGVLKACGRYVGVIALLGTQFNGCEAIDRVIRLLINIDHSEHVALCAVGFEARFASNPVGTLFGNGSLRELIAELDFKLRAIDRALTVKSRNVELALLLVYLVSCEGRRSKNKAQFVDVFEAVFKLLIRID